MEIPATFEDMLPMIALETARMSFPSSMSRGKNAPMVSNGEFTPKKVVENYFKRAFPIKEALSPNKLPFDEWHKVQTIKFGNYLYRYKVIGAGRNSRGLAVKFLNTYMHQLMKYAEARHNWSALHLPLDQKIFNQLKNLDYESLDSVKDLLNRSPYKMGYPSYFKIQEALGKLIAELNSRNSASYSFTSRVQLNWLWSQ